MRGAGLRGGVASLLLALSAASARADPASSGSTALPSSAAEPAAPFVGVDDDGALVMRAAAGGDVYINGEPFGALAARHSALQARRKKETNKERRKGRRRKEAEESGGRRKEAEEKEKPEKTKEQKMTPKTVCCFCLFLDAFFFFFVF